MEVRNRKYNILVIDDDVDIGNMLEELLTREGYDVMRAYSGTEAVLLMESIRRHDGDLQRTVTQRRPAADSRAEGQHFAAADSGMADAALPDLILLDLMLPGISGEELLAKLAGIPVIVVSAKAGIDDKVQLLMDGAADYITKPFEGRELLARIAVQLRNNRLNKSSDEQFIQPGICDASEWRKNINCYLTNENQRGLKETGHQDGGKCGSAGDDTEDLLQYGNIRLSRTMHTVTIGEQTVRLTKTEYAILKTLMLNPTQVITRSALLDRISTDTPDCMESSLKVHISNLRKKLREAGDGEGEYIESVWGIGFKMKS